MQTSLQRVAPLAGAWIEIDYIGLCRHNCPVAPLAGAWIEIPVRDAPLAPGAGVAPLAGAWIEIVDNWLNVCIPCGRSTRGSVD